MESQHAPKRRWFQIHLSTAIVLVICASKLLFLNLPHTIPLPNEWHAGFVWGWPLTTYEQYPPDLQDIWISVVLNAVPCAGLLILVKVGCDGLQRIFGRRHVKN